jgi:hypothetical protein
VDALVLCCQCVMNVCYVMDDKNISRLLDDKNISRLLDELNKIMPIVGRAQNWT